MIHLIGNSHINSFSKGSLVRFENISNEYFTGHWIGPTIAYNFFEHHLPKALQISSTINKKEDYVTLIVGEVDCRLHLPKQADIQKRSDEDIVNECIQRFIRCYDAYIYEGYKVIVTGTHPTTPTGHNDDPENPVWGNVERRNKISVLWNEGLKLESSIRKIPFVSIYNYLVDERNMTKTEYFIDYCHLNSSKVFPFIIKEMKEIGVIK